MTKQCKKHIFKNFFFWQTPDVLLMHTLVCQKKLHCQKKCQKIMYGSYGKAFKNK